LDGREQGGLGAVRRLADDVEIGRGTEHCAEPGPDDGLVVGDDHADRHRIPPTG
jgi:hypothetical protein